MNKISTLKQSGKVLCTPITNCKEQTVERKLKLLSGSILGRPIVKFEIKDTRDVWVPYCYLVYDFKVERKNRLIKKGLDKSGEIGVIFDLNEAHPFQYDIYENGELELAYMSDVQRQEFRLCSVISSQEMKVAAIEYIQNKIMRRFYGRDGIVELKKCQFFFRPAVEISVLYRNRNENKRYAYLDEFGVQNEHVLGLKYRVENNF